jgi:ribonuclease D
MRDYQYIDTTETFLRYRKELRERGVDEVAVDIEGEFNLHIYGEHFCLLQIYDGRDAVLVDPYTVAIAEIQAFFEDRGLLKITYDAAGDRTLLFRNHGIRIRGILDLRPAVELLDFERKGLSGVLETVLGRTSETGKKRFQQYDWTRRPIEPGAIEYALGDVVDLFQLKEALLRQIVDRSLLEAYIRENLKVQDQDPETGREAGVLRSGPFRRLSKGEQQRFRRLFEIRDRYARELNVPPNTAIANKDLFAVAAARLSLSQIRRRREVPGETFSAMVREMEDAVSHA